MRKTLILATCAALCVGAAWAQASKTKQVVTPPEARYFMGATTGSGTLAMAGMSGGGGRPSIGDMMRMGSGGIPDAGRTLELDLGSSLAPSGAPEAFHTLPPGARAAKPVFLKTPERGVAGQGSSPYQQPKGQIKFYWGCGEKAGPGQPVTLTFDKLMRGETQETAALANSVDARGVWKPTDANSKTYGGWPNGDQRNRNLNLTFPTGTSLVGDHLVKGTYTPDITFKLSKTFMDPVRYSSTTKTPGGAIALAWGGVPRATGYSVGVMAFENPGRDDSALVMWSSANRPATFVVMEDITPGEAQRLIGLKAILPPTTTSCTVPAEVVAATKEGSMLMFTAFGDEETFVDPPRPSDPKVTWDQSWFARVLFKSARMDMISPDGVMDMSAMMNAGGPQRRGKDGQVCPPEQGPSTGEVLGSAIGIPGAGMLGKALGGKKQPAKPPGCP